MNLPDTPSQEWAREQGACLGGRRRLGRQSIAEYFRTATNADDLVWIANHLPWSWHSNDEVSRACNYNIARGRARAYGRWAAVQTRRRLLDVFTTYQITFPARLL